MARRNTPRFSDRARTFIDTYTRDLTARDLQRVFTRETRDMLAFFTQGTDEQEATWRDVLRHPLRHTRAFFMAFAMRLTPARRLLYGAGIVAFMMGVFDMANRTPGASVWDEGLPALLVGFGLVNLILLLEVADRLTLKYDLGVARDIQRAMLPAGTFTLGRLEAHGETQPANTVGGDFYDILARPDGRVLVVLGDVAGKGSPAALLMALLLAVLRTLVDEDLDPPELMQRLNAQICRHSPGSRFITLFYAVYTPSTGRLVYVNAGQTPPLLRRKDGRFERLEGTGIALGMFEGSTYAAAETAIEPGDLLVLYSDGMTEAEDPDGRPFEESGLEQVITTYAAFDAAELARETVRAVERYAHATKFADDLTVLLLKRAAGPA